MNSDLIGGIVSPDKSDRIKTPRRVKVINR